MKGLMVINVMVQGKRRSMYSEKVILAGDTRIRSAYAEKCTGKLRFIFYSLPVK
jgi:hypothetical protein